MPVAVAAITRAQIETSAGPLITHLTLLYSNTIISIIIAHMMHASECDIFNRWS